MRLPLSLLTSAIVSMSFGIPLTMAQDDCTQVNTATIPHVNMTQVRSAWLGWYNDYRTKMGLAPYTLDGSLDTTAGNWALFSVKRGTINHQRTWKAAYYDYKAIESWFSNLGLTFQNRNGITFSENVGWGIYKCDQQDCTQELIDSIRTTFDFFIGEKGKQSHAHYDSIVNPEFTKMGVGIAVDPATSRYYLTVHFATDFAQDPPQFCVSPSL